MTTLLIMAMLGVGDAPVARQGNMFIGVGQNRSWHTDSTMTFSGPGYNFTLQSARSRDDFALWRRPDLTQYSLRVGYFVDDHYAVSIGLDHMKYVVPAQSVKISGAVSNGRYAGTYRGDLVHIGSAGDIIERFEHSHGVNLVDVAITRVNEVVQSDHRVLEWTTGVFAGAMVPVTEATVLGQFNRQRMRIAGFGVGVSAGLRYYFSRRGFVTAEAKSGFMDVLRANAGIDATARHTYWFIEPVVLVGAEFAVRKP